MLNKLVLIGLGFMLGYTLAGMLTNLAAGVRPLASDTSALVVAVISLAIILGVNWWERRR